MQEDYVSSRPGWSEEDPVSKIDQKKKSEEQDMLSPIFLALKKLRQENYYQMEVCLGYMTRFCLLKKI